MAARRCLISIREEIRELKFKLVDFHEKYTTHLFLETMPEYDPVYKYCYSTSCRSSPHELQSVDSWLRAISIHMSNRQLRHGGQFSDAVIITPPYLTSEKIKELWIEYEISRLRKKVRVRKLIAPKFSCRNYLLIPF
jgi:hypothetical protein